MQMWATFSCWCMLTFLVTKGLMFVLRTRMRLVLPPSPPGIPFIGHLQLLKLPLHRSLHKLAQAYGPIFYLNTGCIPTVVVSSAHWAKEFLHIHEQDFADRPQGEASKRLFYGNKTVVMMEHGTQWRELRRLYLQQILSVKRVEMFKEVRREEVATAMVQLLESKGEVEVRKVAFSVVGNMMTRMLVSKRLFGNGDESSRFAKMVEEIAFLFGAPIVSDLIPYLAWLDLGGYKQRMSQLSLLIDTFLEDILAKRFEEISNNNSESLDNDGTQCYSRSDPNEDEVNDTNKAKTRDFLDLLLHLYTDHEGEGREFIKSILLDLLSAGIETTTTAIEWSMAELLRNPNCMIKLQAELATMESQLLSLNLEMDSNMEQTTCIHPLFMQAFIKDEFIRKLPYLQAVIKETLRLHPPLPLVVRKMSKHHIHGKEIGGFKLPPGTKLLVNVWALGRDPATWGEHAQAFDPDKFLNHHNISDLHGQYYDFLPFGSGRRGCPGMNLGLSIVSLVLANFVHFFDWELPSGFILDLSEAASRTGPMAIPLKAIPSCKQT